jgi:hypothetical protein
MKHATDLDALLDLPARDLGFLASLPSSLRRLSFAHLMETHRRVSFGLLGAKQAAQALRGICSVKAAVTSQANHAEIVLVEFRLRTWSKAIETELRRRCDAGAAEPLRELPLH